VRPHVVFLGVSEPLYGPAEGESVIGIAPASAVSLFRADLPDLAPAQALAAARLLAADRTAAPIETLHVAIGAADQSGGLWVAVVDKALAGTWVAGLDAIGCDDAPIIPAAMLLPAPAAGFTTAEIGGETILRSTTLASVDDPVLSPLLVGDAPAVALGAATVAALFDDAADDPPFDLRQGTFARKKSWHFAPRDGRRLAYAAFALALISLAIPVTEVIRLNRASAAMEAKTALLESASLGDGASAEERLAALRGPGAGFNATITAVRAAVLATPNAELSNASFDRDGQLTVTAHASAPTELEALRNHIIAAGFEVSGAPPSGLGAQSSVTMGIKGR
jgi:general secretion pathway protein L